MTAFGRIDNQTIELLKKLTQQVREQVATVVPSKHLTARAFTIEQVLGVVLRDWRENNNTDGLLPADVADLRSLIELAVSTAGPEPFGEGLPIYQAALEGLLLDWLENWNAPGHPGPPVRG